jgi:hypothetical protein
VGVTSTERLESAIVISLEVAAALVSRLLASNHSNMGVLKPHGRGWAERNAQGACYFPFPHGKSFRCGHVFSLAPGIDVLGETFPSPLVDSTPPPHIGKDALAATLRKPPNTRDRRRRLPAP